MLKRSVLILFAGSLFIQQSAKGDYVLGMNFAVSHSTTISALGAYDGGTGFSTDETVGIFNDVTGNLVGPDLLFGPGTPGTQTGNMFYEPVTPFVLSPGDYSIMALIVGRSNPGGGYSLSGGNSFEDLGNSLIVSGGGRFNSGTVIGISGAGFSALYPLPDGGTTAIFLTTALAGMGWLRRKI